VAQVVHDDLRHRQVIFDNENAFAHDPSLETPGGHLKRPSPHRRGYFLRLS
jgi:hypothetical protein